MDVNGKNVLVTGGSRGIGDVLKRLRAFQLIPMAKPEKLAARVVTAVSKDRKHVRHPAPLSAMLWLGESPRRLNELILRGVTPKHD